MNRDLIFVCVNSTADKIEFIEDDSFGDLVGAAGVSVVSLINSMAYDDSDGDLPLQNMLTEYKTRLENKLAETLRYIDGTERLPSISEWLAWLYNQPFASIDSVLPEAVKFLIDFGSPRSAGAILGATCSGDIKPRPGRRSDIPVPSRKRLPDTRQSLTHKFNVAGHEGYLTVGLYEDGRPGELFVKMDKEGSTIGGLMDSLSSTVSLALQYGVPLELFVKKFAHQRFEPSGMTAYKDIPFAKSLVDYIFQWMAMSFIHGYREQNAPKSADAKLKLVVTDPADSDQSQPARHAVPEKMDARRVAQASRSVAAVAGVSVALSTALESISDAPVCDVCGTITVRSGTKYQCLNCGNAVTVT